MKFIDEAILRVKAGDGGAGSRHFRREKFVPLGGPDGGDGGSGGSVYLVGDSNRHTLLDFRYRPNWKAESGEAGAGRNRNGKSGDDLRIHVPPGTEVYREDNGEFVADITRHGEEVLLAQGGRGGKGNAFFKTATNQAPDHAQPGEKGEEGVYKLSLKLLADVGLLGFPNAGKSTLISRISSAKPKVADYPFTTLTPNLGVVRAPGRSFVVADIPGLIPGAHTGRGLGLTFLKHVERTAILAHLVDSTGASHEGRMLTPFEAFESINNELQHFSAELAGKEQLVLLTKADTLNDPEQIDELVAPFKAAGIDPLLISSATGFHVDELIRELAQRLDDRSAAAAEPAAP